MDFDIDHSLTVFSSEGALTQCEYGIQAGLNGLLSVGVVSSDGCVLASLKLSQPLLDSSSVRKVFELGNIGVTYSGLQMDFRILYGKMLDCVLEYKKVFGTYPSIERFIVDLGMIMQECTQKGGYRPYGLLLILCGYDKNNELQLYQMDPSGSYTRREISAIGKDWSECKDMIEKRRGQLDDNIESSVYALKKHAGHEIQAKDIDVGILANGKFTVMPPNEVKSLFEMIK